MEIRPRRGFIYNCCWMILCFLKNLLISVNPHSLSNHEKFFHLLDSCVLALLIALRRCVGKALTSSLGKNCIQVSLVEGQLKIAWKASSHYVLQNGQELTVLILLCISFVFTGKLSQYKRYAKILFFVGFLASTVSSIPISASSVWALTFTVQYN